MVDARITRLLLLLALLVALGTLGFMILEKQNWFDALYMTATTITTVGYREVWDLNIPGKVWAMFLMLTGVGMFFYIAGQIALQAVDFKRIRRYRMKQRIQRISNHYIVCGYGRMGSAICAELESNGIPFVVIENDRIHLDRVIERGYPYIDGDATVDENLQDAGIDRATGLIGVLRDDQDNLFLTISARNLNPDMSIITRAGKAETIPKLRQVGANKVINPYEEAGVRMARQAIAPAVVDFLDIVLSRKNLDLVLESITINRDSELENRSVSDLNIRRRFNISIAAVEKVDGTAMVNPDPEYRFQAGDRLIALGNADSLRQFTHMCTEVE